MIYSINGTPGQTKTAEATHIAIKKYKKDNRFLRLFELIYFLVVQFNKLYKKLDLSKIQKIAKPKVKINSNYPILLDKKRAITSKMITLNDLHFEHKFEKDTMIILDEIQFYDDSMNYKVVAKTRGKVIAFMQAHRHCYVSELIIISQHPSRIPKYYRVLCEEFRKQKVLLNVQLKLFGFILINGFTLKKEITYFESEEYNTSVSGKKKKDVQVDFKRKLKIMPNKVFNHYDNIYLSAVVEGKPQWNTSQFGHLIMTKNEIGNTFPQLAKNM
jgi:hypothetical protein